MRGLFLVTLIRNGFKTVIMLVFDWYKVVSFLFVMLLNRELVRGCGHVWIHASNSLLLNVLGKLELCFNEYLI